jgi:hypothetical protein
MTSHNPNDEKYRYCGNCNRYADDFDAGMFRLEYRTETTKQVWIPQLQVILALGTPAEIKHRLLGYIDNLTAIIGKLDEEIPSDQGS